MTLTPFEIELLPFKDDGYQELRTVYSVNNDDPKNTAGIIVDYNCPHCSEWNNFKVYKCKKLVVDETHNTEVYDCKCPNCEQTFDLEFNYSL